MTTKARATAIAALHLTEPERRYLAMHARYESGRQDDFRYQSSDPEERAYLKQRWSDIADALHPEPWGTMTPDQSVTGQDSGGRGQVGC